MEQQSVQHPSEPGRCSAARDLTQTFFLSAGDTNAQGELSLAVLISKIIDIATAHANSLGIGNPSMQHLGYGWVLSRLAVEMKSYPRVNETYSITTWIESWNRHFSVRNFRIAASSGRTLGYATSVWMVLNYVTRENAGTSHLKLDESMISGALCPIARPGKHLPISDGVDEPRPGAIKATSPAREVTFGYSDLDFYRHVNTVRYVSMLMNSFTLDQMDETVVERLELAFMREGHYGERVRLLRADDGLHTLFALSDADDGTALLSAELSRLPRSRS